jgi:hypothetical protein
MEICLICNRSFKNKRSLSYHITVTEKIEYKDYYDRFLKKEDEGICKVCGKDTKFNGKYNLYCNRKCISKDSEVIEKRDKKSKETCLKKYGTKYNSQFKEHRKKVKKWWNNPKNKDKINERNNNIKKTSLKRYGVDNPAKNEKIKKLQSEIAIKNENDFGKEILAKRKKTCLKRYGVDNVRKNTNVINKIKETKLKRYGKLCFTKNLPYSKSSQEFFGLLIDINKDIVIDYQYATKDKEFSLQTKKGNRFYYDFTCHNLKKIIEYNGECFHPTENLDDNDIGWNFRKKDMTVKEARIKEENKKNLAIKNGFEVLTIWYLDNIEESLIKATNFLRN